MRFKSKPIKEEDHLLVKNAFSSFNRDSFKVLEIGFGRGKYLFESSLNNKDIDYLGIEKNYKVYLATKKREVERIQDNLQLVHADALDLEKILVDKVDMIILNFSDPWPKKKHNKRRLTSNKLLNVYKNILNDNGKIELWTDSEELYLFSLEEFTKEGFQIIENNDYQTREIMTEYEEKFRKLSKKIYYILSEVNQNV